MESLICDCMEDVNASNTCITCGYPICDTPGCMAVPGCNHVVSSTRALPQPLRKKLRYAYQGLCVEYTPALIQCFTCQQAYCVDCFDKFAVLYVGIGWTPRNAWRYCLMIRRAAFGLYLVNKHMDFKMKLPKDLLQYIVSLL